MTANHVFSIVNPIALLSWLLLIVLPRRRQLSPGGIPPVHSPSSLPREFFVSTPFLMY